VAAFSARARPGAGVSTPLAWDELTQDEDVRPLYTVQTLPERLAALKKDPWADYDRTKQRITSAMWRSLGKK
jgi:bifunctional non-homologous end joining protein LigD